MVPLPPGGQGWWNFSELAVKNGWKYLWLVFGKKLLGVKDGLEKERHVERNSDNSDK